MSKHAPGPYKVDCDRFKGGYDWYEAQVFDSTGRVIADIRELGDEATTPEAVATARLFVAAPHLLQASQRLIADMEARPGAYIHADSLVMASIRLAVAKALGELA